MPSDSSDSSMPRFSTCGAASASPRPTTTYRAGGLTIRGRDWRATVAQTSPAGLALSLALLLNPRPPEDVVRQPQRHGLTGGSRAAFRRWRRRTGHLAADARAGDDGRKRGVVSQRRTDPVGRRAVLPGRRCGVLQPLPDGPVRFVPWHPALHRQHPGPFGIIYVPVGRRSDAAVRAASHRRPRGDDTAIALPRSRSGLRPKGRGTVRSNRRRHGSRGEPQRRPAGSDRRTLDRRSPSPRAGSVVRPKGINGVWITYDGQRWFAAGKAVRLDS